MAITITPVQSFNEKHKEVIAHFCQLSSEVMNQVFNNEIPADCFCNPENNFQFDVKILNFIQMAVQEKINKLQI